MVQYVARTLGTLWTCTQRVDARAEGESERPPLHQYRVTIQTPNHKLAGGAKFGTVPKQNPTSFCMSCDITPPQRIPIHPNGIPSYLLSAQPRCSSCVDETYALDWKQTCSIHSILSPASSRCDRRARLTRFTRTLSLRPPCAPHRHDSMGPRSGLQYVARTLGTLWTCTQRVDARAEGGSERPPPTSPIPGTE